MTERTKGIIGLSVLVTLFAFLVIITKGAFLMGIAVLAVFMGGAWFIGWCIYSIMEWLEGP